MAFPPAHASGRAPARPRCVVRGASAKTAVRTMPSSFPRQQSNEAMKVTSVGSRLANFFAPWVPTNFYWDGWFNHGIFSQSKMDDLYRGSPMT